jgi:hypothetical protein
MGLWKVNCEDVRLIDLVQDYVRSWTLVLAVVNLFIAMDYCSIGVWGLLIVYFRVRWVLAYIVSHTTTYGGAEEACVSTC